MIWGIEKNRHKKEMFRELFNECETNIRSGKVYLKNGEEIGKHSTENDEKVIVILSGEGIVKVL